MAVAPHVEREVSVHSDNMPDDFVEADRFEVGEVGHVVELDEDPDNVERMDCPAK